MVSPLLPGTVIAPQIASARDFDKEVTRVLFVNPHLRGDFVHPAWQLFDDLGLGCDIQFKWLHMDFAKKVK